MACWKDLYELLMDPDVSADQIVDRLAVPPSRLMRMLASKRLAAKLAVTGAVAQLRAQQAALAGADRAAGRLNQLLAGAKPETARKACLDVMGKADAIYKDREPVPLTPLMREMREYVQRYKELERQRQRSAAEARPDRPPVRRAGRLKVPGPSG